MSIIIDGHNLIPKIQGLALNDLDDEHKLIELLLEYCRLQRKKVEVFFDNAPPTQARSQNYGLVTARFVRQGKTADDAIRERLGQLKRTAQNWTVVSSDREVLAAARWAKAQTLTTDQFANQLRQALNAGPERPEGQGQPEPALDEAEIENWLKIFRGSQDE
jgi:predicted RNA-binding protein with PIN domain